MRLAVSNIAWAPEERREAYRILADAGVTGLEIAPVLFFAGAADQFVPTDSEAEGPMAEIADFGLSVVSMQSLLFGVQGAALFETPERLALFEAGMQRAIALAGRFGIPNLVFGSPGQRVRPEGMSEPQAMEVAVPIFRRLGDAAVDAGTAVSIEFNPPAYGCNFITHLEAAHTFVGMVDHPAVSQILDVGAMHMNGAFDAVEPGVARIIGRLTHVHMSEPELAPAPRDVGQAARVFGALDAAGYHRAVSIEMRRPKEDGLATLEAAVERLVRAAESVG